VLSRLVLTAQYCLVLYGVRHNKRGRRALVVAATLTFVPAIAYLIVGIISATSNNRHVIVVWYVVGLLELLGGILHATLSKTLSFEGTHFNERLNLLTLIVLGEGTHRASFFLDLCI
jgi:low temperature requirement protein LtrA